MKIALIGYGKMGHMIEEIALQRGHEIVCIIDVNNLDDFDSEAFRNADVAIEFTSPTAAYDNILRAFSKGVKVVSGSTGWRTDHEDNVKDLIAQGNTLFWASNFSLGVAIFSAVNRYLARIMNQFPQYDVEMQETHHIHKLDAPSGTAITLAEGICKEISRKTHWEKASVVDENGIPFGNQDDVVAAEYIPADALKVHSIRRGEVPGIHAVTYNSEADYIQICHSAYSRKGFALGAVLAAEFTANHSGLLTISDMFDF